jgi:hypothetical protein
MIVYTCQLISKKSDFLPKVLGKVAINRTTVWSCTKKGLIDCRKSLQLQQFFKTRVTLPPNQHCSLKSAIMCEWVAICAWAWATDNSGKQKLLGGPSPDFWSRLHCLGYSSKSASLIRRAKKNICRDNWAWIMSLSQEKEEGGFHQKVHHSQTKCAIVKLKKWLFWDVVCHFYDKKWLIFR